MKRRWISERMAELGRKTTYSSFRRKRDFQHICRTAEGSSLVEGKKHDGSELRVLI